MVAKYGPTNGFGWKLNEVVAIQSLTVPAAEELKETGELTMILGGGLLVLFIATYFALTLSVNSLVVRPCRRWPRRPTPPACRATCERRFPPRVPTRSAASPRP